MSHTYERRSFQYINASSLSSHVITHNLNTTTPIVNIYTTGGVAIDPSDTDATVTVTDANTVTVALLVAAGLHAIVSE